MCISAEMMLTKLSVREVTILIKSLSDKLKEEKEFWAFNDGDRSDDRRELDVSRRN